MQLVGRKDLSMLLSNVDFEENQNSPAKSNQKEKGGFSGPKGLWGKIVSQRDKTWLNIFYSILVPLVTLITLEWIARGTLGPHKQGNGFFQAILKHFPSFFLALALLITIYVLISQLTGFHFFATLFVGLLGNVPAIITYYKLTMRGEPFLPWDLTQIDDLMGVKSNLEFVLPTSVYVTIGIFILLCAGSFFVKIPKKEDGKNDWPTRLVAAGTATICGGFLVFGIFLSPKGTAAMGIKEDMWMQDRYYRTNGVVTGFLTNLQLLKIEQPTGYGEKLVREIEAQTLESAPVGPLYTSSYAAQGKTAQAPDIIFVMAESFWDVTALPGIEYDQPVLENFTRLSQEGYYGKAYTPSFGGGTCDVEFEVLTGFSMEHLPAGSKPFQQYVVDDMFSLPHYLKAQDYQTLAIHGYGRRFWNRDTAYPRLGIDEFIGSEGFVDPERRRGFVSDNAMVDMIIEKYEEDRDKGPMFIHAVTMQNHTTYNRNRYPAGDLVKVVESPKTISDSVIGQLEDCATGIREMDAALGKLCNYLETVDRDTIVVFWGDHMNPMSDGYGLFEKTGFIQKGDTTDPILHTTPLLIWSNFDKSSQDLGTVATYNVSPLMMDLYGMEQPLYFEFLTQNFEIYRGRTRGITIQEDGSFSEDMTPEEKEAFDRQAVLQYDYMFGNKLLENYAQK